ncbi:MAG: winged helix-turn-helix domain-containing protein [Vulcanimicrobiaceae bacterium]
MDELLLSKIRLGIVAALLTADWASFASLQRSLQTTQGNLAAHLAKLVEAGYIDEQKLFVDRRPQTRYSLTVAGRAAFAAHVGEMQRLLASGGPS